ncbi:unknown [Acetobacter sp. CAG:977]|nr:unknown [Acetobacter sp. CAG:977]
MSVSSFFKKNSVLYPSGIESDDKDVGRWQSVLAGLSTEKKPDDIIEEELLSSDDLKKQEALQSILDTACMVVAGRQVVSDVFRLDCLIGVRAGLSEPVLYDSAAKKILISLSDDFSPEDKSAFFIKQCVLALQDAETPGIFSDAEASVVKSIFAVQMKQEYPDVFEKMTFHKKDKMTAMCEHLYSSFKDWNKTVAEMFKFYK